jgi:hypothetical protein
MGRAGSVSPVSWFVTHLQDSHARHDNNSMVLNLTDRRWQNKLNSYKAADAAFIALEQTEPLRCAHQSKYTGCDHPQRQ